jgi:hypothetical protein
MLRKFYLEEDDHTFIYGGLMFEAEYNEETNKLEEPYVRKEKDRIVKYYPSKYFFVTYNDEEMIDRIVFTMTCWSDDYKDYALYNKKGIYYYECYHGRVNRSRTECNIDFTEFIEVNGL